MLLDHILRQGVHSVAIIGMAKNTGKTVALNSIIQAAERRGLVVGLTSIGLDGEKVDAVYHIPKPRIYAPGGAVVATAAGSLRRAEACFEVLAPTGYDTAIGEVMLVKITAPGYVELAGPTLGRQQQELIPLLLRAGAGLVLVDGAIDRVSSAAPAIAGGTVLATGAALGGMLDDVLAKTLDRVERLALPGVDPGSRPLMAGLIHSCKAAVVKNNGDIAVLAAEGSLVAGESLRRVLAADMQAVVLSGAVGDEAMHVLNGFAAGGLQLVIRNGTCLFADRRLWHSFIRAGGRISVLEPIHLLAVTVNPVSPVGAGFCPETMLAVMGKALYPCPVLDVVKAGQYAPETGRAAVLSDVD